MPDSPEGSEENSEEGSGRSEGSDASDKSKPPAPPESPRHVRLRPIHGALLLVLLLIAGLGAAGFFGNVRDTAAAQSEALRVSVEYPERFRYKEIAPLTVRLQNRRAQQIDTVSVRFDSTYIDAFSNVQFLPSATKPWVVELTDVKPGETRRIHVHLQADSYGRHRGQIRARTESDRVEATLQTFVFP